MGKGKKTFIDRKNAVTFHLVHRSQHDPLVTDSEAPQRVLVEAAARQPQKQNADALDPTKRKEEQLKFGIHFDDDYNYLQHLKKPEQEVVWEYVENPNQAKKRLDEGRVTIAPKINLPSSVFATEFQEEEGMLNKAAPQPGPRPDWDPDVVAALDDDFDFEDKDNQLDDDFVLHAMGEGGDSDDDMDSECDEEGSEDFNSDDLMSNDDSDENDDELMDRLGPLMRDRRFANEETKSQFTEYSMSSSVIRRNEQLSLLDDRFERFYATYDDPELGDLATEDIEGSWGQKHPYVLNCFKQFKKSNNVIEYNKQWDEKRLEQYQHVVEGDQDPNEELVEYEVDDPKEKKWDCESILTTNSNIYNHPKLIDEPKRSTRHTSISSSSLAQGVQKIEIDPKTGLPVNVLHGDNNQLTAKALAKLDQGVEHNSGPKSLCAKSILSTLSVLSIRPKDETPEEKKERKRLLKEYRNERRIERKANADAFKEEKKRQIHVNLNRRQNQQGNKIL